MEEWVGGKWHHFITKKSAVHYPDAKINLTQIRKKVALFYRALGGDPGISIGHTSAKKYNSHRNWVQKISGTGSKAELGHFSNDFLYLPESIDSFPQKKMNEDLYYWLAAMASFNLAPHPNHLIEHNHYLTQQVLKKWPGLESIYIKLVQNHLLQRDKIKSLPEKVQSTEKLIQNICLNPMQKQSYYYDAKQMPQPVTLWLQPISNESIKQLNKKSENENLDNTGSSNPERSKRYQTEQVDTKNDKDGFISFRLESMFSWSEFINVDRTEDDGDDDDAVRVADDLDQMSLSQGETSNKIRLDLDLPSSEYDDILLKQGILLPEWDFKKNQFLENHCSLSLMQLRLAEKANWPSELLQQSCILKRQFEALKPIRKWHNRQHEGDEADLNEFINFAADKSLGKSISEPMLYRQLRHNNRDLSTLILTDLSLSTDAHVNDQKKVIDVIKEGLFLFAESLHAANENFAIAGFTSKKRDQVRYYDIKAFKQPYDQHCQDQIYAIKPAYYTRMGAAIRYASQQLQQQASQQKLLIILTDGKPNDLDKYESRYGLEDTKKAVTEAKQLGLTPFCVSIDYMASDYLPYIFGHQGYIHLNNALDLPKKLPSLFFQLVN